MIKPAAKKSTKTTAKRAPAKPAAKRSTARKSPTTTAAKRPVGRPPASAKQPVRAAQEVKAEKPKKAKIVRDSFTMPESEYALIGSVKKACLGAGFEIKKSEILRIGVTLIAKLDPKKIKTAQATLLPLKAGRPKKHK